MKLTTPVTQESSKLELSLQDSILCVGSCFASNIASALEGLYLKVESNPNGIVYNPISVLHSLRSVVAPPLYTAGDLVQRDGLYHSMDHHGDFSDSCPCRVLERINRPPMEHLPDVVIITLGSSWVYKYNGSVVANCHKIPSKEFQRERLTFKQITQTLKEISELFSSSQIIFTLSPIRHTKDGLVENSLSKALLRAAIGEHIDQSSNSHYFPAYEIMMDELRDYRFYQSDMLHPTQQAVEYIIEKFEEHFFNPALTAYTKELRELQRSLSHRPLHPQSESYQRFRASLDKKIEDFTNRYPTAILK